MIIITTISIIAILTTSITGIISTLLLLASRLLRSVRLLLLFLLVGVPCLVFKYSQNRQVPSRIDLWYRVSGIGVWVQGLGFRAQSSRLARAGDSQGNTISLISPAAPVV